MNAQRAQRFTQLVEQQLGQPAPPAPTPAPAQQNGWHGGGAGQAEEAQRQQQVARKAGGLKKAEYLALKRAARQKAGGSDAAPGQRADQGKWGTQQASAAQRWQGLAQQQEQQLQRLWDLEARLGGLPAAASAGVATGEPAASSASATWHPIPTAGPLNQVREPPPLQQRREPGAHPAAYPAQRYARCPRPAARPTRPLATPAAGLPARGAAPLGPRRLHHRQPPLHVWRLRWLRRAQPAV
jgi:hypothetical protein